MSGFRTAATTSPLPVIANLFDAAVAVLPGGPERIGRAAQRLDSECAQLSTLSEQQIDNRSWDIALYILLIPGAGALTPDQEEKIGSSKGRIIAIQEEVLERCDEEHQTEGHGDSEE